MVLSRTAPFNESAVSNFLDKASSIKALSYTSTTFAFSFKYLVIASCVNVVVTEVPNSLTNNVSGVGIVSFFHHKYPCEHHKYSLSCSSVGGIVSLKSSL